MDDKVKIRTRRNKGIRSIRRSIRSIRRNIRGISIRRSIRSISIKIISIRRIGTRNISIRKQLAILTAILLAISAAQPVYASEFIKSVKLRIGVEQFDDQKRPILTAKPQNSSYEVENIRLQCSRASGPEAENDALSEAGPVRENYRLASPSLCEEREGSKTQEEGKPQEENNLQDKNEICEIVLSAEDGKSFAVMRQEDIRLSGVEGICVKAVRKQGGSILALTIKLTGLEDVLGEINSAKLSPSGLAVWEMAPNARLYQVQLYHDGERAGLSHRTEQTVFDFSPLMTEQGVYTYKVTPYSEKRKKGKSQESTWIRLDKKQADENKVKQSDLDERQSDLNERQFGWKEGQDGLHYWYQDGLYPQNTWLELDGGRYYFDSNGIMILNLQD